MRVVRNGWAIAVLAGVFVAGPASAQFFMKSRDLSGAPLVSDEVGVAPVLPGATAAERRAGLVWNMRAALNVAALQCQFEPTLLTVNTYNAVLKDHAGELKASYDTLTKYFVRTAKTKKEGQSALDQFGTRTYSAFATVSAQYNFCQTAAAIGRDAIFTPRGHFGELVEARTRELRNSLTPYGDQQFARFWGYRAATPRLDAICWSKKGEWVAKKCGDQAASYGPIAYAAR